MALLSSVPVRSMISASGRPDVSELLVRAGLDPDDPTPTLIDADAFYEVIEMIVGDGDLALPYTYAQAVDVDAFGVLGLAWKTAPDLRHSLQRAERYVALLGDAVFYELRPEPAGGATFIVAGRPASRLGMALANEGAIAAVLSVCRQAARIGPALTPAAVSFAHGSPGPSPEQAAYFGCPVAYDAAYDALHLDAAFLETPTRLADDGLSAYFVDQLERDLVTAVAERSIESRVRHVIANGLADGVPPMRVAAQRMAMSERTLQRRLADDGLRFQDVVVDVRCSVATALLTTTEHSLLDIAFLTGFAEQSSFQRAFKRWTGRTPLEARRA